MVLITDWTKPEDRRDSALERALREVVPGHGLVERPDQPDGLITTVRCVPAADAEYADYPDGIDERLRAALASRSFERLYTHQAQAVGHALARRNVVVTTPTASGKTLCYNIPVMDAILKDTSTRALYLFPTKALAQDQLAELDRLTQQIQREADVEVGVFTYDGDTPQDDLRLAKPFPIIASERGMTPCGYGGFRVSSLECRVSARKPRRCFVPIVASTTRSSRSSTPLASISTVRELANAPAVRRSGA